MSNDYYNSTLGAIPETGIRSASMNAQFAAVALGFDAVQALLKPALKLPAGETPVALPNVAGRADKALFFDAAGAPTAVAIATELQVTTALDAAATASADAATAVAAAASVTAAQKTIAAPVVIVSGTTQLAVAGNHYVLVNAAATTVTLPAVMVPSDVVIVSIMNDRADNVIAGGGNKIMGLLEDLNLNIRSGAVALKYADATRGAILL